MTDLELLATELGVSERTLRRAISEGTLRAGRPTPRRLDLSFSERAYVRRSWPFLSSVRAALRTEPNVRFALMFGSAATGDDAATSDLDLVVDLHDTALDRVLDLGTRLTEAIGRPVDLVRLEDAAADPLFLADVIAEGRVLVDRAGVWPHLRARETTLRRAGQRDSRRRAASALTSIDRLLEE
jgi:predicted nucleotidyltransferase